MSQLPPAPSAGPAVDPAAAHIAAWRRRLPAFERARRQSAGDVRQDPVTTWVRHHFMLGHRLSFDAALQDLLTPAEQQRLETDTPFTRAWRLFVDYCWVKKHLVRAGLVAVLVLIAAGVVAFLILGLPEAIGPGTR